MSELKSFGVAPTSPILLSTEPTFTLTPLTWLSQLKTNVNPRTPGGFGRTPTPGGGVDFRPPLRSRKLRRLEKNGKRRLVDWEKHYKKHSDNFSLKSKLRSPGSKNTKIFCFSRRLTWLQKTFISSRTMIGREKPKKKVLDSPWNFLS